MRALFAGGGTGGHVFPAIAVAQELRVRRPEADIVFAGAAQGVEGELVPRAGFTFEPLIAKPLLSAGRLKPFMTLLANLPAALRFVGEWRPEVVLGTGGYASAVTVFAAAMHRVPTMLLDFNAIPGRVNRLMAPMVDRLGVSFPQALDLLPRGKAVLLGTPLRREFRTVSREQCRAKLGLHADDVLFLAYGGSQGSRRLNQALWGALRELLRAHPALKVVHLCGQHSLEAANSRLAELPAAQRDRYTPLDFVHAMHELIAASDFALCRAGGGLMELAALGVPMILVPLPNAMDDHQLHNAKYAAQAGAQIELDRTLTPATLIPLVELMMNAEVRAVRSRDIRSIARPDAAERVCDALLELARARGEGH